MRPCASTKMIKTYSASLDKLYEMLQFITDHAKAVGFDNGDISKIELASEEALVNIISYAYPNSVGFIDIICGPTNAVGLKIVIRDGGIPYNPLTNAKKTDHPLPATESRAIGGYGVFFILKMMDEVDYKRENNTNILTLIKYRT